MRHTNIYTLYVCCEGGEEDRVHLSAGGPDRHDQEDEDGLSGDLLQHNGEALR